LNDVLKNSRKIKKSIPITSDISDSNNIHIKDTIKLENNRNTINNSNSSICDIRTTTSGSQVSGSQISESHKSGSNSSSNVNKSSCRKNIDDISLVRIAPVVLTLIRRVQRFEQLSSPSGTYVSVFFCMHINMYTYTVDVNIHTYTLINMYACLFIHIRICIHICIYIYLHIAYRYITIYIPICKNIRYWFNFLSYILQLPPNGSI
jgi:hypothetical protein